MNKSVIKRITTLSVAAAMLASAAANASAATIDTPPVKAAIASETSGVYQDYLDGKVQMAENSGVRISPYSVKGTVYEPSEALPSAYKSNTTDIRDQGAYNTCWAFSAMGALETFLVKDGKGKKDLSEEHLAWWSTRQYNSNGYGWQLDGTDSGGYSIIGAGYLASWQGAKSELDVPYGRGSIPGNMNTAANAYNATGITYVSDDIDSVKYAVYTYGAVATSFNSGDYYNDNFSAYCQTAETNLFAGHAITIVGWDDNYDRSNFAANGRPSKNGAWLVKNSWGDYVGDDGYLWISYYDRYILDPEVWGVSYAITGARTANGYDKLYQNEKYGATYETALYDADSGYYFQELTFANVFNFDSVHNKLQKVIFETQSANASYKVYYMPVSGNEPVADSSKWTLLGSGKTGQSGYISVDTGLYSIPSGKGAIGVTVTANGDGYSSIGVDEWLTDAYGDMIFVPDSVDRNESFVILDGYAYDMVDIYESSGDDIGGTFVIKALTTSKIIGDLDSDNEVTSVEAVAVIRHSVGMKTGFSSDDIINNCDVNFDGRVSTVDSYYMQKKIAGLMSDF